MRGATTSRKEPTAHWRIRRGREARPALPGCGLPPLAAQARALRLPGQFRANAGRAFGGRLLPGHCPAVSPAPRASDEEPVCNWADLVPAGCRARSPPAAVLRLLRLGPLRAVAKPRPSRQPEGPLAAEPRAQGLGLPRAGFIRAGTLAGDQGRSGPPVPVRVAPAAFARCACPVRPVQDVRRLALPSLLPRNHRLPDEPRWQALHARVQAEMPETHRRPVPGARAVRAPAASARPASADRRRRPAACSTPQAASGRTRRVFTGLR